jgi:hypothetical protein
MKSTPSFFFTVVSDANERAVVEECRRRVSHLAPIREILSSARNTVTRRRGSSLPQVPVSVAYDVALVSKNN